jgi:hypothetical protein
VLAQITTKNFVAAIVLEQDVVTETAPILRFLKGWSRDRVRDYCKRYNWQIAVVREAKKQPCPFCGKDHFFNGLCPGE